MRKALQQGAIGLALVAAGVIAGSGVLSLPSAHGEVRKGPPPESFQTGGQLSVPVLREIASTLRQIDSRLARMEISVQKLQMDKADAAVQGASVGTRGATVTGQQGLTTGVK